MGLIARGGRDAGVRKSVKGYCVGKGYNMYSMHRKGVTLLERDIICIACIGRELYTGEGYNMYSMHRKGVAVLERDIICIVCIGRELLYWRGI